MPGLPLVRHHQPPILPHPRKTVPRKPIQAAAILQAGRPPQIARKAQPVQRGAAAGFKVRLVPHAACIPSRAGVAQARGGLNTRHFAARDGAVNALSRLSPLLHVLEPERAHRLALWALEAGLAGRDTKPDPPALTVRAFGLSFKNPIGLAAGFDKNGTAIVPLMHVGFGCVEAGTVTPLPQEGNPRPRMFRLPQHRALINRLGFNNDGLQAYIERLKNLAPRPARFGANVGINKNGANPERDYPALVAAVTPYADYVTINISSPNTPGLRDLQGEARLRAILQAITAKVPVRPPLLIKVAPDLSDAGLEAVVETAVSCGAEGLIISNTTLWRPPNFAGLNTLQVGGLSGAPLFDRSTAMLRRAHRLASGRLALIGCGGVRTGADVLAKIRAGAALVQLYTEFIYAGPALIPRLKNELLEAMQVQGFERVEDAVGTAT
jgi:dihydroorotate dehydrogenase